MGSALRTVSAVPEDFPRGDLASIAPGQPTYAVRVVVGEPIERLSSESLLERYEACLALVEQLKPGCRGKYKERCEADIRALIDGVRMGAVRNRWEVSADELDWVLKQLSISQMSVVVKKFRTPR